MTASGLLSGIDKWLHPEMLNEAKCLMPSSRPRPNLKRPNRTLYFTLKIYDVKNTAQS